MKLVAIALLFGASSLYAQTIPWVPPPNAMFVSSDGTGNAGTWEPVTSSGNTVITWVPPFVGAYCSSDGTGNAGTWEPCKFSSGTGTISSITSTGSSISVTGGSGPTANVELNLTHANTWTGTQTFTAITQSAANCLAATVVTVPCVVYQGSFTGLGVSGTTGVQTFYTSNAPAGAVLQFCPNIFTAVAGTGGNIQEQITFTTPGGQARSANAVASVALTSTGLVGAGCATIAAAANSSLSFAVLAVSGTGTPTWETNPVVLRIH